jgi:hypothetical protein
MHGATIKTKFNALNCKTLIYLTHQLSLFLSCNTFSSPSHPVFFSAEASAAVSLVR